MILSWYSYSGKIISLCLLRNVLQPDFVVFNSLVGNGLVQTYSLSKIHLEFLFEVLYLATQMILIILLDYIDYIIIKVC